MGFLKKLWYGETSGLTTAAFIVGAASLISRLIGVLRDRILASTFGAGAALDAYYAAFRLPDFLYNLIILGALSAGFIPVFTQYLEQRGKEDARKLAEQMVSLVFALMTGFAFILILLAPILVPLTTPGYEGEKLRLTIQLSRIMFLSPILLGLSGVMGGVLQSIRRFLPFALAPIFYNLGIIFGAIVLTPRLGLSGLAWGVVIGAFFHLLIQASVAGLKTFPRPSFQPEGVRRILKLMAPRTIGLAITQVNLVILLAFATSLREGSVSVFNLASNLQYFPVGIIGVSFAIAAFPALSRAWAQKSTESFRTAFSRAASNIIFFLVPMSALFLIFRAQIVRIILGAGAFDWTATKLTASVLLWFTLSLVAQGLVPLLARGFYALQNTWTPVWIGIITEILMAVSAFLLRRPYGVAGLAMAFSLAVILQAALLFIFLYRKQRSLAIKNIVMAALKTVVATFALGIVAYLLRHWIGTTYPLTKTWQVILQAAVGGVGGTIAFILIAWILKSQELMDLWRGMRQRLTKG